LCVAFVAVVSARVVAAAGSTVLSVVILVACLALVRRAIAVDLARNCHRMSGRRAAVVVHESRVGDEVGREGILASAEPSDEPGRPGTRCGGVQRAGPRVVRVNVAAHTSLIVGIPL